MDIYLSNEKGDHTTGNSSHITFELEKIFDQYSSPFNFNMKKMLNEWVEKYIVKAKFHVELNGIDQLITFENDCISKRICPETELFNIRSSFTGKYKNPMTKQIESQTLLYESYEP